VAGLDTNFRLDPFGAMPQLIRLANEKVVLKAKCYKCGKDAEYSARLKGGTGKIVVGAADTYQPACSECHTICDDSPVIVYPDLRPARVSHNNYRIEIAADSMRVGKTTAVKVIAEGLRARGRQVRESYEDWEHNPYLKGSYEDPEKNFLESQKWFIRRKHEQIMEAVGAPLRSASFEGARQIFIQDVAPETDYCYAATNLRLGRMRPLHFAEYEKYYRSLDWRLAPMPDLLVYLSISDDELIDRAKASKREFETVDSDYFLMMKRVNREWLKQLISNQKLSNSQMRILEIDTDKLDFANNEKAKGKLTRLVLDKIS